MSHSKRVFSFFIFVFLTTRGVLTPLKHTTISHESEFVRLSRKYTFRDRWGGGGGGGGRLRPVLRGIRYKSQISFFRDIRRISPEH